MLEGMFGNMLSINVLEAYTVSKHIIYMYFKEVFLEKIPKIYRFYLPVVTETRAVKQTFKAECGLQALHRVPDAAC